MNPPTILIVDDDPVQRRLAEAALARFGYQTTTAEGGGEALRLLQERPAHVSAVLLDLVMPGGPDGIAVLRTIRARGLRLPVIVQTAQGGLETAISAMREGAFDFVVKPASPEKLHGAVERALRVEAVQGDAHRKDAEEGRRSAPSLAKSFPTGSPLMERAVFLARKAAVSEVPVLIEGESGTGKEVLARAIQAAGARKDKPFVTVNCGAIPANLVESILFGHEKGAFTGATERHAGKFAEANGGTLFLDEVGDLPLDAQVKLLRAVQDGEIDPVGGRATLKVDVRLISATHRDLLVQVAEGRFREDLFYRLNVFPITLPPLRDRRGDIPGLVSLFIARIGARYGGQVDSISGEALALLQAYDWPGNIRQLENAVLRGIVLCDGRILTANEFPQIRAQVTGVAEPVEVDEGTTAPRMTAAGDVKDAGSFVPPPQAPSSGTLQALDAEGHVRDLAHVELDMIRFALDHYHGQMSEVARRLGIGRSTLYRKLKEYGLDEGHAEEERDRLAS